MDIKQTKQQCDLHGDTTFITFKIQGDGLVTHETTVCLLCLELIEATG